ncbi:MAG: LEA type 2 family protein [Gammaproteobacteria bacterium]
MLRPLSWLAVLAVAALVLGGCASLSQRLEPPRVSLAGLELEEIGLFEQRYRLRLRIQNPNDVELPIAGMAFSLYLNEEEFASGLSDRQTTVPPFGEAVIEASVTSSLTGVIGQLRRLSRTEAQTFSYRLSGHARLLHRAVKYPFEYRGEVDLTEMQD